MASRSNTEPRPQIGWQTVVFGQPGLVNAPGPAPWLRCCVMAPWHPAEEGGSRPLRSTCVPPENVCFFHAQLVCQPAGVIDGDNGKGLFMF